ncbi:TPA: SA1788 family PVL leukocidin-associated protein, partial [Staphylococcus aureus]
ARGKDLIQNVVKPKKVKVDGKMMTVSEIVKKYNLSKGLINYRIAKGLTGDALIAPPQEKPPSKYTEYENEQMKKKGLTPEIVRNRVAKGWEMSEAIDAPFGMKLNDYREIQITKALEREREMARQRRKEAELRRKKPHLFDVPQKHSRDPYWFDVTYNQMFKKWSEA